jgi:GT2 family glycosyltransferase
VSATASDPRVLGVVLNYNGRDLTRQTVASLLAMSDPRLELLVVDNGSTDGSYQAIAAEFPAVRQVRTEVNLGISGGLNLGIRDGLAAGHDFLMLMNNDLEVAPDLLSELLAAAGRAPTWGCIGPKCYFYFGDRRRIWSAGGILRFREAVTRERGSGAIDRGQFDRDEEVDYVNGCCMLIRREAMLAAGLWDPVYHVSVEDADWCMRMKARGFACGFAHRARLWHMVSPTTGGYTAARTFRTARSTAIFVRKYAGPGGWASYLCWTALALPGAFLRELPRRNTAAVAAKLRGTLAGLRERLPEPPAADARLSK